MVITYIMLLVNLTACLILERSYQQNKHANRQSKKDKILNAAIKSKLRQQQRRAVLSFIFVWIFQIGLCLLLAELADDGVGCVGISIVWCAMAGWLWQSTRIWPPFFPRTAPESSVETRLHALVVTPNLLAIIHYVITEEVVTAVAHLCALVLGALLQRWANHQDRQT